MNKFLKVFSALLFSASAVFFVSCGPAKNAGVSATDKTETVVENSSQPIKVTVSTNGYEPKTIAVKKGQSVKLAFLRTDEKNCGDELVFPKLNIKKNLPVGETVLVEFTPQEPGEIGFTCGMDMLRGKVLVQ